jgi:hypothetical protein
VLIPINLFERPINDALRLRVRQQAGRKPTSSAISIDSQTADGHWADFPFLLPLVVMLVVHEFLGLSNAQDLRTIFPWDFSDLS